MKKVVFALLIGILPLVAEAQRLSVSTHWDARRATAITAVNYAYFPTDNITLAGFVEAWYNREQFAFPQNEVVLFSKNWVQYRLTKRLSLSLEVEVSRNLAGAFYRFPTDHQFKPNKVYVHPKVGFKYQILQ